MIGSGVDHKFNFFYLHITKTAGTSVHKCFKDFFIGSYEFLPHGYITSYKNSNLENYFKFSFVRNPWDKVVSHYFFIKKSKKLRGYNKTFKEFVELLCKTDKYDFTNYKYVPIKLNAVQKPWLINEKGDLCLDFIGKFENLQEDFNLICDKIKIPRLKLPHKNKSYHDHYTKYYTNYTKNLVRNHFAPDIELFGYEY